MTEAEKELEALEQRDAMGWLSPDVPFELIRSLVNENAALREQLTQAERERDEARSSNEHIAEVVELEAELAALRTRLAVAEKKRALARKNLTDNLNRLQAERAALRTQLTQARDALEQADALLQLIDFDADNGLQGWVQNAYTHDPYARALVEKVHAWRATMINEGETLPGPDDVRGILKGATINREGETEA